MEAFYVSIAKSLEKIRDQTLDPEEEARLKCNLELVEASEVQIWKAVSAEFVAQALFVFLICLAPTNTDKNIIEISFEAGLALMAMVQIVGHCSGGHINPAVTLAMAAVQEISPIQAVFYVAAQSTGAIIGSNVAKFIVDPRTPADLAMTTLSDGVNSIQGLCVETLLTFVLVSVTFGLTDRNRLQFGSQPLVIGLTYTMGHLCAFSYTGSSMNPSRSLGPAFALSLWQDQWIYWVGPIVGGVLAGLVYKYVLCQYVPSGKYSVFVPDNVQHPLEDYKVSPVEQGGNGSVAGTMRSDKSTGFSPS